MHGTNGQPTGLAACAAAACCWLRCLALALLLHNRLGTVQPSLVPACLQVHNGPLDLPLFKKPVDLTLHRTKRLTSRAFDLHLTVRGIE